MAMSRVTTFFKRHSLAAGFAAVLTPLLVLLGMQFVWLQRLERVSALAHRATLSNYLEAVGTEIQYFYRSNAERALNIPATLFIHGRLGEVASLWDKKPVQGVRRLFLVDYTRERFGRFQIYNPVTHALESPPASDEALAIIVACTPWQIMSYRGAAAKTTAPSVDERNPDYRIVLNPITDDASRVVGVAGMILDEDYFQRTLLPAALRKGLPGFFPDAHAGDLVPTVRSARGELAFGTLVEDADTEEVTARIPFVFSDWTIGLRSRRSAPERWARASFAFNMTLSILLAAALTGGIILALRAADRAMRLSQMKSDFVSNVSHELRTPLASIRIFAELLGLGRATSPEKVREYGNTIEAESRRLSRLIDNILDFSRIESGRKTYRFAEADLREVVASTVQSFEVHLRSDGFRVLMDDAADALPPAMIDADAIGQAIHNLLDNAVKYSGDSREVRVRLAREGDGALISVADRGIGIAREEQDKIFERFHRVSTGLLHEVKGSGLGLSIVQHIVQVHHGRITVESEPGRGSTFTIHLPLRSGAAPAAGG